MRGAYLNGLDEAPCPLAFMTTGMAASFMQAIQARLAADGIAHWGVRLVQDNHYGMEGSLPKGTMVGGAMPVDLEVEIAVDRPADEIRPIVLEAVASAPVAMGERTCFLHALCRTSLFVRVDVVTGRPTSS